MSSLNNTQRETSRIKKQVPLTNLTKHQELRIPKTQRETSTTRIKKPTQRPERHINIPQRNINKPKDPKKKMDELEENFRPEPLSPLPEFNCYHLLEPSPLSPGFDLSGLLFLSSWFEFVLLGFYLHGFLFRFLSSLFCFFLFVISGCIVSSFS